MHDPERFVTAISKSNVRALLIGRRALVVLGAPLLTADYDFWIHRDDIESFNALAEPFGLFPNHEPDAARKRGRYVLENDDHVDVLVAKAVSFILDDSSHQILFDDAWANKIIVKLTENTQAALPSIDDLIKTKRFALRPKDIEDIAFLNTLKA